MHYNRNAHYFFAIKLSVPFGIKQYLLNNKNISSSNSSTSLRRQKTLLFQFFFLSFEAHVQHLFIILTLGICFRLKLNSDFRTSQIDLWFAFPFVNIATSICIEICAFPYREENNYIYKTLANWTVFIKLSPFLLK